MSLSPTLLSTNSLVLLHPNFKNNLAKLRIRERESQIAGNLEEILRGLINFSNKLNSVEKTIEGIKSFIKNEGLEIAKFFPKQYFDNGFDGADDLFFYLRKQDPRGYWISAIYLFFPHLFLEKSLNNELRCCSFRNSFETAIDVRLCEVYGITYSKRPLS